MNAERPPIIKELPSEFGSDEKRPSPIDTIVIHSMYNPTSDAPFSIEACKAILDTYEVSAHYIIDREGIIHRLVQDDHMAWHAGKSRMPNPDAREKVNAFSIGIELVGNETSGFTDAQYESLKLLTTDIMARESIAYIVGHNQIAGREVRGEDFKTDPWMFDWNRYRYDMANISKTTETLYIGPVWIPYFGH